MTRTFSNGNTPNLIAGDLTVYLFNNHYCMMHRYD